MAHRQVLEGSGLTNLTRQFDELVVVELREQLSEAMTETATAHVNLGRRRQTIQRERQPLEPVADELRGASVVTSNRRFDAPKAV